jgi:hypothetical protein
MMHVPGIDSLQNSFPSPFIDFLNEVNKIGNFHLISEFVKVSKLFSLFAGTK